MLVSAKKILFLHMQQKERDAFSHLASLSIARAEPLSPD
jgi:AmiR/NasT family two-component response regulator